VLTLVLAALREQVGLHTVLLVYLLLVVVVGAIGGLWPAVGVAIGSFLLANWYFTEPLYTFTVTETENIVGLFIFLTVAVVVSGFVSLAARRAAEGARARSEAEALSRLAGSVAVVDLLEAIRRTFGLEGATLWHGHDGIWSAGQSVGTEAARGPSSVTVDDTHVLALAGAPLGADEQRLLAAFATELASSLHLEELEAEALEVDELERANDLRTAILSAVSHDLRTPLAAIKASVTSLLSREVDWAPEDRDGFLHAIDEESDRLDALVGNLLDMSRLQTGALQVDPSAVGLDEVVPAALRSLGAAADEVEVRVPETLPRVTADPGLLERAIANVVANAVRHAPRGTIVHVDAGTVDDGVDVRVVDRGPGVPRADREAMFRPFQRLGDTPHEDGVGLGLAVAKGFVEAMGGEIEVEDTPGGGLTVVLRLRAAP
jgi:two-component system sensor histidine kinase KdpD